MADPDQVRTLYFLGFDLDERLAERLAELKRGGTTPTSALAFPVALDAPFSSEALTEALALGAGRAPAYDVVPGGRQLEGAAPAAPELLVHNLAAALLPVAERYPTPFYRVKP
jgi:hypothetical protein